MKRTSIQLFALALAATASAQAPNRAAHEKAILANETAATAAFAKGDAASMEKHLLSDGLTVDASGVFPASELFKMLAQVKVQPGWKIEASQFQWLDDNNVMHVYKWSGKRTMMGQPLPSTTWSSTLWVQRGGQWKAAFHQETTAVAPPPPAPAKK